MYHIEIYCLHKNVSKKRIAISIHIYKTDVKDTSVLIGLFHIVLKWKFYLPFVWSNFLKHIAVVKTFWLLWNLVLIDPYHFHILLIILVLFRSLDLSYFFNCSVQWFFHFFSGCDLTHPTFWIFFSFRILP